MKNENSIGRTRMAAIGLAFYLLAAAAMAYTATGVWSGFIQGTPTTPAQATTTVNGVTVNFSGASNGDTNANGVNEAVFNSLAAGTFATVASVGADPWSPLSVASGASLSFSYFWDSTPDSGELASTGDTGTLNLQFSEPLADPVLNIDRIGGAGGLTGSIVSNSAVWTLSTTTGQTLTRLSGVAHFQVAGNQFFRTPNAVVLDAAQLECKTASTAGTGCGSVRINGLANNLTFVLGPSGTEGSGGDGAEIVLVVPNRDYGDAPASYLLPNHNLEQQPANIDLRLGAIAADTETSRQANDGADEDGLTIVNARVGAASYSVAGTCTNATAGASTVNAWFDFNQNGVFDNTAERITTACNATGAFTLTWTVPAGGLATVGTTYLRARICTNAANVGCSTPNGPSSNGEIEDYPVTVAVLSDYGDAPDTAVGTGTGNYNTLITDNGPSHIVPVTALIYLGAVAPDTDLGTLQDATAIADDANNVDDEDGVTGLPASFAKGQTFNIPVQVTGAGFLNAWIDWNRDGDFLDAGEQVANAVARTTGTANLSVTVPATAVSGATIARFRYSTTAALLSTGAATDGEVEDYAVNVVTTSDLSITKTNTPASGPSDQAADTVTAGTATTYSLRIVNAGPDASANPLVTDTPGAGIDCPGALGSTIVTCAATSSPAGATTCPAAGVLTTANLFGAGIAIPNLGVSPTPATPNNFVTLTFTCTVN